MSKENMVLEFPGYVIFSFPFVYSTDLLLLPSQSLSNILIFQNRKKLKKRKEREVESPDEAKQETGAPADSRHILTLFTKQN